MQAKDPKNLMKDRAERMRAALAAEGLWWWVDKQNFHRLFAKWFKPGTEPDAEQARLIFEGKFEESAWKYEAYRRFEKRCDLPSYPELPFAEQTRLADKWPVPEREARSREVHPMLFAEDFAQPPALPSPKNDGGPLVRRRQPGWTRYQVISYNLHLNTGELVDAFKQFIKDERRDRRMPEPDGPGAPTVTAWKALEDWDIAERIPNCLTLVDTMRTAVTKAKKRAPRSLE